MEKSIQPGRIRAASRLIRKIEDNLPEARESMKEIFPLTGKSHVIGITGSPGAGKSTIVDGLIGTYRALEKTVAVLAVDPTSPFTGGAILGDRIRMQRHAEDPGVFIRSFATRGAFGGLCRAVGDAVHVLDAAGKDVIILETVGTGQQEVDIIYHAQTVIVVLVPGMGDDIQAIKAGIMEIADIFVINKADRAGATSLERELAAVLDLSSGMNGWYPPVVKIANSRNSADFRQSLEELSSRVRDHQDHLIRTGLMEDRRRRRVRHELMEALRASILEPILEKLVSSGEMGRMEDDLLRGRSDPYSLAEKVAGTYQASLKEI